MTSRLVALCLDAHDPPALARFWSGLLGRDTADSVLLAPDDETGLPIRFLPSEAPRTGPNRMHVDLTSASAEHQERSVRTALRLGARHIDVGQRPEEGHVVLADPEGNEFCVLEPGNAFLAGCGLLGGLSCDGTREVGRFWSEALGWPLVWDQDEETAIQSPQGGPKIAWGGPPVAPRLGRNRLHLDIAPPVGGDQRAEVDRLLSLGATLLETGEGGRVVLADPDGNELCVLSPR